MAETTYRDLDFSFRKHPLTGDISTVTDEAAVKMALRNLVRLAPYDKPFNREISSPLQGILFEPIDRVSAASIRIDIQQLIQAYETRVENVVVTTVASPDENRYEVSISFRIKKMPNLQTLELFLPVERLR